MILDYYNCEWLSDKEIVEIKSEDDLKNFNKYDKRYKTILTVICGILTALNVLVCISHYFIK